MVQRDTGIVSIVGYFLPVSRIKIIYWFVAGVDYSARGDRVGGGQWPIFFKRNNYYTSMNSPYNIYIQGVSAGFGNFVIARRLSVECITEVNRIKTIFNKETKIIKKKTNVIPAVTRISDIRSTPPLQLKWSSDDLRRRRINFSDGGFFFFFQPRTCDEGACLGKETKKLKLDNRFAFYTYL